MLAELELLRGKFCAYVESFTVEIEDSRDGQVIPLAVSAEAITKAIERLRETD